MAVEMRSDLKVLFNCFSMPLAEEGSAGAGRYVEAILPTLSKKCSVTLICSKKNQKEYCFSGIRKVVLPVMSGSALLSLCRTHDIYFNPLNGFEPEDLPSGIPVVSLIHDLKHCVAPEFFLESDFHGRNRDYGFTIARSDGLVAISRWELENFAKYFNASHTVVVHHAAYLFDRIGKVERRPMTPFERFYCYPAVTWPHKNHYRLVEALALANQKAHEPIKLVLTGVVEGYQDQAWWKKLEALGSEHVEVLGHVSGQELASLMTYAKGMIFPSLYEGFGIPVLDAMNYELPVLTTRLAAVPEIAGETVAYFTNPFDGYSMAADILAFDQRIEAGGYDTEPAKERAAAFSTEETVTRLYDYLSAVAQRIKGNRPRRLFSDHNAMLNYQKKRLTIVLDIARLLAPDALHNALGNCDGMDLCFMSSYGNIPVVQQHYDVRLWGGEAEEAYANALKITYYSEHNARDRVACLAHMVESVIRTPYLIYLDVGDGIDLDHDFLSKAVALLDRYRECFSVIRTGGRHEVYIRGPLPKQKATRLLNDIEKNGDGAALLDHFNGRVMRTNTCKVEGAPGSLALYSRDITRFSNIVV